MNQAIKILIGLAILVLLGVGVWWFANNKQTASQQNSNASVTNSANIGVGQNLNAATHDNGNTNTADQVPEGWKLFVNQSLKYSLYYPPDWIEIQVAQNIVGFRPADISPADETWGAINVIVRDNPERLPLEDFYSNATSFENLFEVSRDKKEQQIGKRQTVFFEIIPGAVADSAYAFLKDNQVFEVRMHRDQISHISDLEKIYSDMVASIQ